MPPPSLLYIQILVMEHQTQDTHGVRRTQLKLQVWWHNMTVWRHDSTLLLCVACANTACLCEWYIQVSADHVCVQLTPSASTYAICLPYERCQCVWYKRAKGRFIVCACVRETHCEGINLNIAFFHWSGIGGAEYATNHNHGNVCFSLWSSLWEH